MKNKFLFFALFISIISVFAGFTELTNSNKILKLSDRPCCVNGQCNSLPCSTLTNIEVLPWPSCMTLSLTCKDCLDFYVSECLCPHQSITYCTNSDGSPYYGQLVECPQPQKK